MKMTFRWYGESDSITLDHIRQIPCMTGVVTAVYSTPVGEVWPQEEIDKMKDATDPGADRIDFAVKNKRTGETIGIASIKDIDRQNGHAEIVLGIGDEENRLAGFGVDLMIVLADVVFHHFGFEKCYSKINDDNRLGLKSALSFGFTAEGKLRKHTFIDGKYVDQWILGMTREEYENLSIVPRWKSRG